MFPSASASSHGAGEELLSALSAASCLSESGVAWPIVAFVESCPSHKPAPPANCSSVRGCRLKEELAAATVGDEAVHGCHPLHAQDVLRRAHEPVAVALRIEEVELAAISVGDEAVHGCHPMRANDAHCRALQPLAVALRVEEVELAAASVRDEAFHGCYPLRAEDARRWAHQPPPVALRVEEVELAAVSVGNEAIHGCHPLRAQDVLRRAHQPLAVALRVEKAEPRPASLPISLSFSTSLGASSTSFQSGSFDAARHRAMANCRSTQGRQQPARTQGLHESSGPA